MNTYFDAPFKVGQCKALEVAVQVLKAPRLLVHVQADSVWGSVILYNVIEKKGLILEKGCRGQSGVKYSISFFA
jgi:hypothetical protein